MNERNGVECVVKLSQTEMEQIGECAESNAGFSCNFSLGMLCEYCFVWQKQNVPRDCAWIRENL